MGGHQESDASSAESGRGVQTEEAQLVPIRCTICGKRGIVYLRPKATTEICCRCNRIIEENYRNQKTESIEIGRGNGKNDR